MIRLMIRLVGYGLIAIGFATLIVDGTASLGVGALRFTNLLQIAKAATPQGFINFQNYVQYSFFENSISFILFLPATFLFFLSGLILVILARRPKADIGFEPMQ